jgi:hypothetical protein
MAAKKYHNKKCLFVDKMKSRNKQKKGEIQMLVGDIIEMTKEKTIAVIARDHLTIGEKKLREVLKNIGGVHESGKKGWTFQGESEVLEKSIYDFVQTTRKPKAQTNKRTNEQKKEISKEQTNEQTNKNSNETKKESTKKRASFDLDTESLKKIKIYAVETDTKISDVVEEAIQLFIAAKKI